MRSRVRDFRLKCIWNVCLYSGLLVLWMVVVFSLNGSSWKLIKIANQIDFISRRRQMLQLPSWEWALQCGRRCRSSLHRGRCTKDLEEYWFPYRRLSNRCSTCQIQVQSKISVTDFTNFYRGYRAAQLDYLWAGTIPIKSSKESIHELINCWNLLDNGKLPYFVLPARNGISTHGDAAHHVQVFAGEQSQLIESVGVGYISHLLVVLLIGCTHLSSHCDQTFQLLNQLVL